MADASRRSRRRSVAWMLILIADGGLLLWGLVAALAPEHLLGPRAAPILAAGYEGFTGHRWSTLDDSSRGFITVLFQTYGAYGVSIALLAMAIAATAFRRGERWAWWALLAGNTIAFGAAMMYDRIVGAIGPFEALEYVGLAFIYGALAMTAPFRQGGGSHAAGRAVEGAAR